MFYLGCMVVSANLELEMPFSLYFSFSLRVSLSSVWMNSCRKDMVWDLVFLCSLLPISGMFVNIFLFSCPFMGGKNPNCTHFAVKISFGRHLAQQPSTVVVVLNLKVLLLPYSIS